MIKAVIFDLDGVIVSTDELHYNAWKKMADKEGIYFDKSINHRLRGVSRMDSLEIILEKAKKVYTDTQKKQIAALKNKYYVEMLQSLNESAILPGVMEIIDTLKKRNIKVAIGSSSKNAKLILKQIGLEMYFDAVSDGTNIERSKPDPQVFMMAADMLNVPYEECAVVEDAVSGLIAAKAANMMAFATGDAVKSDKKDYVFTALLTVI